METRSRLNPKAEFLHLLKYLIKKYKSTYEILQICMVVSDLQKQRFS